LGRWWINLQFNAVGAKSPASHMAVAVLIPALGRRYGTFDAFRATDYDALLKAPVGMTIEAEQIFEKDHSISHSCKTSLRSAQ
jgi:hypothetical protein